MTRSERRAAMPTCTAWIDEWREYSPDLQIKHAEENGVEWGERAEFTAISTYVCANGKELTVGFLTVER